MSGHPSSVPSAPYPVGGLGVAAVPGLYCVGPDAALRPADVIDAFGACANLVAGRPLVAQCPPGLAQGLLCFGDSQLVLNIQHLGVGMALLVAAGRSWALWRRSLSALGRPWPLLARSWRALEAIFLFLKRPYLVWSVLRGFGKSKI